MAGSGQDTCRNRHAAVRHHAHSPIDRLALRGAIACTWALSDSPQQYEIDLRESAAGITKIGSAQHTGTQHSEGDRPSRSVCNLGPAPPD
jgi:hypothetical protein